MCVPMQVVDAYDSIPARANDTTISIVGEDGDIWFCSIFWGWMGEVLTHLVGSQEDAGRSSGSSCTCIRFLPGMSLMFLFLRSWHDVL